MAASMKSLEDWLSERLMVANPEVDLEIFVPYITGILDTDTSSEDKRQSLEEVLEQVVESGEKELCTEIISQWEARNADTDTDSSPSGEKLDMKLSSMIGHATVAVVKPRHLTEEEKARKKAIIAQYQDVSDGDGEDDPDPEPTKAATKGASAGGASGGASGEDWMVRNMNSLSVLDAEREKREKSKLDYERKKEKDKLDREAQRQKQQDRKDNEKKRTQKGERRR